MLWIMLECWANDQCQCECKKHHAYERGYTWYHATCYGENGM